MLESVSDSSKRRLGRPNRGHHVVAFRHQQTQLWSAMPPASGKTSLSPRLGSQHNPGGRSEKWVARIRLDVGRTFHIGLMYRVGLVEITLLLVRSGSNKHI